MLNIHISGKSVKSVFSATLLRVLFKQSVMTASYLIKHLCFREIRRIRVFRHQVKSVSVSSQSCLQVLSLNIQVVKSVFSATLFKFFRLWNSPEQSILNAFLFLSKNFSPNTEKMDFTDFVEPWSFEFIHFLFFSF